MGYVKNEMIKIFKELYSYSINSYYKFNSL